MKLTLPILIALVLISGHRGDAATVVNGSFENNYNSWLATGISSIETAAFGATPTDLANQALINTGDGANNLTTVANLESFLSLSSGSVATVGGLTAQQALASRGSGFSQVVTGVLAGDTLTFDFNFLTTETPPAIGTDFAFLSISRIGGPSQAALLANTSSLLTAFAGGGFTAQTGYLPGNFVFADAGDYTIGFGVVTSPDAFFASGLLVDNVGITSVPEPSALAGVGVIALGGIFRRRRK